MTSLQLNNIQPVHGHVPKAGFAHRGALQLNAQNAYSSLGQGEAVVNSLLSAMPIWMYTVWHVKEKLNLTC